MQLRDYQIDMIDRTREAMRSHQRVLLQSPTGSGKTALAVHMMKSAMQKNKSAFFNVHQKELLKQTSKALWLQRLEHGMIASGKGKSNQPVQVASVATLVNRLSMYEHPDLLLIDEAHRALANTYIRIIQAYPNARLLGLTATPIRTDGRGLGDLFDHIVKGPSIRWLIDNGYLCDYDLYGIPSDINLDDVKTTAGDYNAADLALAVDKPKITGDAVEHYIRLGEGGQCVVMCVTIDHANHVANMYRAAGIKADSLHSISEDRDGKLSKFEDKSTKVLATVGLMTEGVDIPGINVIQWLRPTKSRRIYMQGNGRGFRPKEDGSGMIILDHVGNYLRFGMPDDDYEWSLDSEKQSKRKKSEEKDIGIQSCGKCLTVFRSGVSVCPGCGAEVELKERKIEVVEGNLEKIDRSMIIRERRQEQGQARGLTDLVDIGIRRGMKNPAVWSANVFAARQGRKPTQDEFSQARSYARSAR